MRHFVYLDTDTLNSYLSQINGGLLKSTVAETADEVATTKMETSQPNKGSFKTEIGFKPLLNFTLSEDKDSLSTTNTLSQTEIGKELIEKILHDNAFDLLVSYLKKEKLINNISECKIGDYLEINNNFAIRDLEYLTNIFTDEFIDFMGETTIGDLRNEFEANATNMSSNVKKTKEKQIETIKKNSCNEFLGYKKIFKIIGSMIPYSEFIICENFLIPITNKYLRESLNQIKFNYSGKIKILGKLTSTLKNSMNKENERETAFGEINTILEQTFKELYINFLGFNENMKIVMPIALYFE
ncbi:hypothetical protein U728_1059 [Clostridium botulinum 202F]|uniref:DUF6414 family protein n=1 Tax=unclassified Clostridium TaxID=2614128 RepID=UPI0005410CB0|nr:MULTISPECIES: hypothetical protein [unclassified Clostridium]AIY78813.1 hypothetical protein U728_1059 [Clostridium botulinum 202F]KAI3345957.1 hypothetical protein CIT17_10255 [Clostridium botulinum]KON13472.1 hypothetical protein ACP50_05215 [Clostridium botulinum]MBY6987842.1 hypothetical protein [Clostridium botulinum]NFH02211.1 hypothetical protein [Clostridium botulinum]